MHEGNAGLNKIRDYVAQFGERLPPELRDEITLLAREVTASVRDQQDKPAACRLLADSMW